MTRLTVWGMGPADAVEMGAQWPIPFLDHLPENDMYSQVDAPNCGLSIFSILLELNQSASEKCKFYLHTWAALKAHCHVSILVPQLFFPPSLWQELVVLMGSRHFRACQVQRPGDQRPNW